MERFWNLIQDFSRWAFHQPHSAEWWLVLLAGAAGLIALLQLGALKNQIASDADATAKTLELLRQQIQDARESNEKQIKEMEESRKGVLRPVMSISQVVAYRTSEGICFDFQCANIGPGPAREVEGSFWAESIDRNTFDNPVLYRQVVDRVGADIKDGRAATGILMKEAIAAGRELPLVGLQATDTNVWFPLDGGFWVVFIELSSRDVYGDRHPYPKAGSALWKLSKTQDGLPPWYVTNVPP